MITHETQISLTNQIVSSTWMKIDRRLWWMISSSLLTTWKYTWGYCQANDSIKTNCWCSQDELEPNILHQIVSDVNLICRPQSKFIGWICSYVSNYGPRLLASPPFLLLMLLLPLLWVLNVATTTPDPVLAVIVFGLDGRVELPALWGTGVDATFVEVYMVGFHDERHIVAPTRCGLYLGDKSHKEGHQCGHQNAPNVFHCLKLIRFPDFDLNHFTYRTWMATSINRRRLAISWAS